MKELETCNSRFEATILTQLLDEQDIPWIIQANDAGGMFPTRVDPDSVQILVSDEDYSRAMKLVHE